MVLGVTHNSNFVDHSQWLWGPRDGTGPPMCQVGLSGLSSLQPEPFPLTSHAGIFKAPNDYYLSCSDSEPTANKILELGRRFKKQPLFISTLVQNMASTYG